MTNTNQTGTGFLGTLCLVFIVLKLTGTIDWSWWWVIGPIWMPAAIIGLLLGCVALVYFVVGVAEFFAECGKD